MNTIELNEKELEEVVGGSFWPNTYTRETYHKYGISTSYNTIMPDIFEFNGRRIFADTANKIVEIGSSIDSSINSGYRSKDRIGVDEAAFIRAFNLQLNRQMGPCYSWDGKPGTKFETSFSFS